MPKNNSILGTFDGHSCTANVFNNNDMNLSSELFKNLLASDEFKDAMEHRYYIGFLGHPEDPNCMDFQNACIVMTDMTFDQSTGEVNCKFDLVDTPVGKVVKAFIDAGVQFGISIRGAGDVDSEGYVDPDTFIFRGFDLVTFPAYTDCVPVFQEIAASSDLDKKVKFKKVCAAMNTNLKSITSCEALEIIQDQFREGSDQFNQVQERIDELNETSDDFTTKLEVAEEKIKGLTDLYLEALKQRDEFQAQAADAQLRCNTIEVACSKKVKSMKRIIATHVHDLEDTNDELTKELDRLDAVNIQCNSKITKLQKENRRIVAANEQLRQSISRMNAQKIEASTELKKSREELQNFNLKYNQKVQSNSNLIAQKDSTIEGLEKQLSETVTANKRLESDLSNLDKDIEGLTSRVEAAEQLVAQYQQAYADIYANALGVHLDRLTVTASTSVKMLQDMISSSTSTSNMMSGSSLSRDFIADDEIDEIVDEDDSTDSLITM